jgi:hypothetical protein
LLFPHCHIRRPPMCRNLARDNCPIFPRT